MSKQRITVHVFDPDDRTLANELLWDAVETQAFVTGLADIDTIVELEAKGLMVERTAQQDRTRLELGGDRGGGTLGLGHTLRTATTGDIDAAAFTLPNAETILTAGEDRFLTGQVPAPYLLTIEGPLLPEYRAALADLGITLEQAVERETFMARLDAATVGTAHDLAFVQSVVPLKNMTDTLGDLVSAGDFGTLGQSEPDVDDSVLFLDLRRDPRFDDDAAILDAVLELGGEVVDQSRRKMRIAFPAGAALDALAAILTRLPEVDLVEPYVPPELHQDHARPLVGLRPAPTGLPPAITFDGKGEIIAIADTGLDDTHPDFSGRVSAVVALGRTNDASDPVGHGTHVAGSALGDGSASNGTVQGIAPGATLYFQSIYSRTVNGRDRLEGLPLDLETLFQPAYDAGARIHNNSWGNAAFLARYSISADEVDAFVHENPEMLVVFSAGNEGTARNARHAQQGFVDLLSVTPPATAKNALTVGAQRSDRSTGGGADRKFGDFQPDRYPDPPISQQTVGGDPASLAAFSSRGPTGDERIKPDIVAPGTAILSARSKDAGDHKFWGNEAANGGKYAYMAGTSMAAPQVAGAAALVRQYYREIQGLAEPSAAIIKATLINGAQFLSGADSVASNPAAPNYDQGFGALDLWHSLPHRDRPSFVMQSIDATDAANGAINNTGDVREYRISVDADLPLRICLAWSDPPGRGVQNDLDLAVRRAGSSKRWIGNEDRPQLRKDFDRQNNVEIVRIEAPEAGIYQIRVAAWNILRPPQPFALVVTGAIGPTIDALF